VPSSDRIDELKKRYDENPRRFFASLANEYRKSGDLEQAITLCQTHLAEQPSNMNGHVVYGQALFEAGRYDEAKVTFESALTLDPENLIALRHLGDIACTNGANEQAREWYVRVLDADPRNDEIIALLASIEEQVKKDKIGAPIASLESMAPREARTQEFKPPQVITPLHNTTVVKSPVSDPTPVVPIDSVETVQIEAVKPPAPDMGLMDLAIDFDSIPDGSPTPVAAAPAPDADLMMDPFGDPTPAEFEEWTPPVVENPRATFESLPPIAEPNTAIRSDVDMLFGDSLPAEPAPPFVTETMAELYLQQGFTNEALEVYRQLSEQSPDDERLKERVRKLERGERTSVSLDANPEPDSYGMAEEVPLGGMLDFDATPIAAQAPIDEIEQGESAEPHTARTYFAALSSRKAVQGNGRARVAPRVSAPRVSAPRISGAALTAPALTAVGLTAPITVTSINELFSTGAVSDRDELIANAFSQVAGAAEMGASEVKGKPTAPAATELSLDSVFKDVEARASATVPRQSQNLRFDQFFSTSAEDSAPAAPAPVSTPVGEPGSPAEIKQFQSWLTGLKKP
jgi:tetratricopeptide (TPR) repeat protein